MIRSQAMRHLAFFLATLAWAQAPSPAPTLPANVQADLDVEYSPVISAMGLSTMGSHHHHHRPQLPENGVSGGVEKI